MVIPAVRRNDQSIGLEWSLQQFGIEAVAPMLPLEPLLERWNLLDQSLNNVDWLGLKEDRQFPQVLAGEPPSATLDEYEDKQAGVSLDRPSQVVQGDLRSIV